MLEENVQNNQMGDAAALAVTLKDRREAAKLNNVGKHEPKLSENGIPADVLEKLLPGDDIIELEEPVVNGGFFYRLIKRSFDVVSCGCALIILAIRWLSLPSRLSPSPKAPSFMHSVALARTARFLISISSAACTLMLNLVVPSGLRTKIRA